MRPHGFITAALSIALLLLASSSDIKAQQSGRLVEAVEVLGNRRLTDGDILKHIKTRPGQIFIIEQLHLDLESVIKLGVFDKRQTRVSTEEGRRGGIIVLFEVVELPVIKDVKVEGLRHIEEIEIFELLRSKPIHIAKGAVYDPARTQKAIQAIKEFLISHYWSNVTVTVRQENQTASEVSLTFLIKGDDFSFVEVVRDFNLLRNRQANLS